MIKHVWSLLCQESVINHDDNSLNINRIIEGINIGVKIQDKKVNEKINLPLRYEIISSFTREGSDRREETGSIKVRLLSPKQAELSVKEHPIIMTQGSNTHRFRIKTTGIPITEEGVYHFSIKFKNKDDKDYIEVASLPLQIQIEAVKS